MVLMLSENEVSLIRTALARYSSSLRDEARVYGSGYSPTGIELCQRRMKVDDLIDGLLTPKAGAQNTKSGQVTQPFAHRPYIVEGRAA